MVAALRAGAEFDVTFSPWTMSQGYRDSNAPDVWDDPLKDADLLALAVSTSVRDLQPESFLDVHEALFRGRHEKAIRLASWSDIDKALVKAGVEVTEDFYTDPEMKSPAAIEKLLPKEQRALLDELCVKESSGHTLVHESDKRPAIKVDAASAFANS